MLTPEKKTELESKHGEILVLRGKAGRFAASAEPPWEIVLRKPTRAEYKMWRARVQKQDPEAQEGLVVGICVCPDRSELMAVLEKHPSIPEAITAELSEWMGMGAEAQGKE